MVNEAEITSRKILIKGEEFDITDFYKRVKVKADELGYLLIEKEQATKFTKYGQELKFEFHLHKEFDYFGKSEITIEVLFNNINKVKGIDKGDVKISIKGKQVLDYKNRWGNRVFNKFLFSLYLKINKKYFMHTYTIRIIGDVNSINDYLKDNLQIYHP